MPRPKRDLVRANFYIQTSVMKSLQSIADERATNVSELVRQALRMYTQEQLGTVVPAEQVPVTEVPVEPVDVESAPESDDDNFFADIERDLSASDDEPGRAAGSGVGSEPTES